MSYEIKPTFTVSGDAPTQQEIDSFEGNIFSKYFYTEYDSDTKFEYIIEDQAELTNDNKKEAWFKTLKHHYDYCQVLPQFGTNTNVITFYGEGGFSSAPLTIKADTIDNIKSCNIPEKYTWQDLWRIYKYINVTARQKYENATQTNIDAYNKAAYVYIQGVNGMSELEFKKLMKAINETFEFSLPFFPGHYYFNKITNKWEIQAI